MLTSTMTSHMLRRFRATQPPTIRSKTKGKLYQTVHRELKQESVREGESRSVSRYRKAKHLDNAHKRQIGKQPVFLLLPFKTGFL